MRYTLHWGRDNARRISSVADLEGLLSFLATVRGREGAPHGVDLLPAGATGGGLQLGIGHPHRAFVVWLDGAAGPGFAGCAYGIDDDLEAWPEPIGFDCGVEVVDFKPAWTRVKPRQAVQAAREYVLTGEMPTCLRFDPNA
jgi:Immunity protein Imm1